MYMYIHGTCTDTSTDVFNVHVYIHVYMNDHFYRTLQCTKERKKDICMYMYMYTSQHRATNQVYKAGNILYPLSYMCNMYTHFPTVLHVCTIWYWN